MKLGANTNKLFLAVFNIALIVAQILEPCEHNIIGQTEGEISTPGYPNKTYPPNEDCTYTINAPPNHVIVYSSEFVDLELPDDTSGKCIYDSLTLYDGGNETRSLCGQQIIYPNATSSNQLRVIFKSDFAQEGTGFQLKWYVLDLEKRPIQLRCNFDDPVSLCAGWINKNSSYPWYFTREHTDSANTGPEFDHTTGNASGKYAYIEGSQVPRGSAAILQSPAILLQRSQEERCLRLWYHMYGKGIGALNIFLMDSKGERILIANRTGNQGDAWHELKQTITLRTIMSTISIEATRGTSFASDIAIDDVQITKGSCDGSIPKMTIPQPPIGGPSLGLPTSLLPKTCASTFVASNCSEDCNVTCGNFLELAFTSCSRACFSNCACPEDFPIFHQGRCVDLSDCPSGSFINSLDTQSTNEDDSAVPETTVPFEGTAAKPHWPATQSASKPETVTVAMRPATPKATTPPKTTTTTTLAEIVKATTQQVLFRTTPDGFERKKIEIHDALVRQIFKGIAAIFSKRERNLG